MRLIAASQRGDVRAFNELVALHERGLYTVAYRVVGNAETAADITQEALIAAFQSLRSFRGGSFRAWLGRITMNKAYDALRALGRRKEESLDDLVPADNPEDGPVLGSGGDEPESYVVRREVSQTLQATLELLPDDQRAAIVLFDIQGYRYDEIAYVEQVRVGTVKSRLSRARARMRELLIARKELLPVHLRHGFE